MSNETIPAPLWRRLAAALYDGLLLLGLWMATLLLSLPLRDLFGLTAGSPWFRALLFLVGLGFFIGFWIRGGQTLGMRAWRLQVRTAIGAPLRWPAALIRYGVMLLYWGIALTPFAVAMIARFPTLAMSLPRAGPVAIAAAGLIVLSIALRWLDPRGRLPHDWAAGTEVLLLSRNPGAKL